MVCIKDVGDCDIALFLRKWVMMEKVAFAFSKSDFMLVRMNGLEPSTPCMSSRYSNQLSYTLI